MSGDEAREAAVRGLLGIIEGRTFGLSDCLVAVGPDERCGDCPECWVRNVERHAADVRAALSAPTDTEEGRL